MVGADGASSYAGANWNAISRIASCAQSTPSMSSEEFATPCTQRRQRGATLPLGRLSAMGPARRSSARAASWSSPEMPFGSANTTSSARRHRRMSAIGHVELRKGTRRSRSTRPSPRTSTASCKARMTAPPNPAHRRGTSGQEKDVALTRRREVCGLDLQHHAIL
jgi:hypothetical protein